MKRFSGKKIKSVRFYENGKKCCSLRNDRRHFCVNHREEGMKLMGFEFEFKEDMGENYEDELYPIENDYLNLNVYQDTRNVKNVKLNIDRGIKNFILFGNLLKRSFPKLECLTIEQSYSIDSIDNFIKFLKMLNVNKIIFSDFQLLTVEGLKRLEPEQIISKLLSLNRYSKKVKINYKDDVFILTN